VFVINHYCLFTVSVEVAAAAAAQRSLWSTVSTMLSAWQ